MINQEQMTRHRKRLGSVLDSISTGLHPALHLTGSRTDPGIFVNSVCKLSLRKVCLVLANSAKPKHLQFASELSQTKLQTGSLPGRPGKLNCKPAVCQGGLVN